MKRLVRATTSCLHCTRFDPNRYMGMYKKTNSFNEELALWKD
jgi:hypothetical protein